MLSILPVRSEPAPAVSVSSSLRFALLATICPDNLVDLIGLLSVVLQLDWLVISSKLARIKVSLLLETYSLILRETRFETFYHAVELSVVRNL